LYVGVEEKAVLSISPIAITPVLYLANKVCRTSSACKPSILSYPHNSHRFRRCSCITDKGPFSKYILATYVLKPGDRALV